MHACGRWLQDAVVQLFNVDGNSMKIGALYRLVGIHYRDLPPEGSLWLYLGPRTTTFRSANTVTLINHLFLVGGQERLADASFLKFLYPIQD